MAKNFNALDKFSKTVKQAPDSKTQDALSNYSNAQIKIEDVAVQNIKINLIRERQDANGNPANEFHEERTDLLEQSIEENGLMNPLILLKLVEADQNGKCYQIVSGHRRLTAMSNLHEKWVARRKSPQYDQRYVEEQITKFESVPARIFGLDVGQEEKEQGLPYITEGQEHSIYLETNFETRGLTFADSLLYVDELRVKIKNDLELKKYIAEQTYKQRLEKNPNARMKLTVESDLDKVGEDAFLSYYLTEVMQIKGWSRPSVTRYLYICDYENKAMSQRLKASIKAGEITISKAYNSLKKLQSGSNVVTSAGDDRNSRYQNKIKMIKALADSIQLKQGKSYTTEQLQGLQTEINQVKMIIEQELQNRTSHANES